MKDGTYTGDKSKKRKKSESSAGHYTQEGTIQLMGCASSPVKDKEWAIVSDHDLHLLMTPQPGQLLEFEKSSPENGPLTRYLQKLSPKKSILWRVRIITTQNGIVAIFLLAAKFLFEQIKLPPIPSDWVAKDSPVPKVSMTGMKDIHFTCDRIKEVMAITLERKRKGQSARCKGQAEVLGISATKAMRQAGISVPDGIAQWLHCGEPHWLGGPKAQVPENLVLGTKYANADMELVNPVLHALLVENKYEVKDLYVDSIIEWEPGYENIRLARSLNFIIKDAPGDTGKRRMAIPFNMLTLTPICLTLAPIHKTLIINAFENSPKAVLSAEEEKDEEKDEEKENATPPRRTLTFKN